MVAQANNGSGGNGGGSNAGDHEADHLKSPLTLLAQSLEIEDDDDLNLLEGFFIELAGTKGLSGRKIFAALKNGASLGEALEISQETVEFLYARAHRWVGIGRHEKAEPIFRALCIIDNSSADYWVGLGICLRARSEPSEALIAFRTASDRRPQWELPHFHALDVYIRQKDWDGARVELAAFEEKADKDTHGAILVEVAKYKKALGLQERQGGDQRDERNKRSSAQK